MDQTYLTQVLPAAADGDAAGDGWTIRQMAQEYGVTMRALRFYESRGLLSPARNPSAYGATRNSLRIYDARQRRQLEMILRAKKFGYTLTETQAMLSADAEETPKGPDLPIAPDEAAARIALLEQQRDSLERAIAELKAAWNPISHQTSEPSRLAG